MGLVAAVVGVVIVLSVVADMVNTLVTTSTGGSRYWLTRRLYEISWRFVRLLGRRLTEVGRERLYATFAPVSILLLLVVWVAQQIVGFGLIWWAIGGVEGAASLFDSVYFSGVVYFTLGFGELVPVDVVPRIGALVEALFGVLTTALVIGYLPALYGAYSERERKLLTLDDGQEDRITPQSLLLSRTRRGDISQMFAFFASWEDWVAGVIETHSTFPMLVLFRSKDPGQHWVTALGVVTDAALLCQMMVGAQDREPYWMVRRSIRLFEQLTEEADLASYRAEIDKGYEDAELFRDLYDGLIHRGFEMLPYEEARAATVELRRKYDARLEYLIDGLDAPRGFWGHAIGHRAGSRESEG
ncbi:MAG: two pore domain potassium channel family protein [bacterium]|nr:two pore domain potassium channel family protein [bacterium]